MFETPSNSLICQRN